jgi:hypothetical protein
MHDFKMDVFSAPYNILIKNFNITFVKRFLLIQNKQNLNFFDIICSTNKRDTVITKILDTLWENFRDDQVFFDELVEKELMKDKIVPTWMDSKFKPGLCNIM